MHPTSLVLVFAALLGAAPSAPPARERQGGTAQSRVQAYLGSHDVPSAAELRALDAAPEKALMAIVSDERAQGLTRARAVAALRVLPSPAVEAFLHKLIDGHAAAPDATTRLILRRAALALGWLGGANAAQRIAELFENDDPEVRVDAVLGISMTRAEDAAGLLRKQQIVESSPRVREQIQRRLAVLAAAPPEADKAPAGKPPRPSRPPMRGGF